MFSGPGHGANPSSVSRMSHMEPARRSSEWSRARRQSIDHSSRHSTRRRSRENSVIARDSPTEDLSNDETRPRFGRRQASPSPVRSGVFENLASFFGRTEPGRPKFSRRRSSGSRYSVRSSVFSGSEDGSGRDDSRERWGYSSGEEGSSDEDVASRADLVSLSGSMAYDSEPPSPISGSQGLPLMSHDPIFGGETRIDIEIPFALLDPPPPGPPSRQTLYLTDEDTTIRFVGYETVRWRHWIWILGCWISLGILGLIGHWFPKLWIRWVAREKAFKDASSGFIVVEVSCPDISCVRHPLNHSQSAYRDINMFPLQRLDYPYPLNSVFHEGPSPTDSHANGHSPETDLQLETLITVDYRYSRFALDPRNGLFSVVQ